jgi:carboxymethylenebutenolidase
MTGFAQPEYSERAMKTLRSLLATVGIVLSLTAAYAAPEKVTYKSGDETVSAQLYLPSSSGQHPALVVIHEWWGVTPWVDQQAEDFAAHGYASLVVDLYRGQSTQDPSVAHELMRGVPQDRAARDLTAAVTYLESRKDIQKDRIGTVGWCMGGGYALQLALADHDIKAVAINYGALATDTAQIAAMPAAVLGNFGALDHGIPPKSVEKFATQLKADGKHPDIKIYPDAGHAFENPGNKEGYRPADAEDAHARMLAFFGENLAK